MQSTGCFIGTTVITGCQVLRIAAMGRNSHCPLLFHFGMCALPHPPPSSSGSLAASAAARLSRLLQSRTEARTPSAASGTVAFRDGVDLTPWPGPCRHRAATNFYGPAKEASQSLGLLGSFCTN